MNRREFIVGSALASLAGAFVSPLNAVAFIDDGSDLVLTYSGQKGATIPADFVGLSYERAQLTNPDYFSAENRELVKLFRELSTSGNLRLGGSSGEHTPYTGDHTSPALFEIFGPEHTKTVKEGLSVSKKALVNLRAFLDAAGWSCLYGLRMAQSTPAEAAQEAADVQQILGPRLLAIQIGNEPDSFRNRYRPAAWGPADFLKEWRDFYKAITAAAPGVKFAGPDISNKLPYLTAFAATAHTYPDLMMLTGHYYAMGPAGSPDATFDQLMEPEAKTTTFKQNGFEVVNEAIKVSGLPYRMSEGNSCWDGGKAGISDTHASAIWGADAMFKFAKHGWIGINWHGGGYGNYSPIVGTPSKGYSRRPLFWGTQFAQQLNGATFLQTPEIPAANHLSYHALTLNGRDYVVLINKQEKEIKIQLPDAPEGNVTVLTGPSAGAKDSTTLLQQKFTKTKRVTVPPLTAMIIALKHTVKA